MKALEFITLAARKALTGNRGSGIRSIPSAIEAEAKAGEILAILQQAGIPINQLDDYIRSEADVAKFLNIIKAANKPRVIPGSSAEGKAITEKLFGKKGEVVDFPQKRTFKQEIDAMKKSGDLVDEKDMVISDKITDREMFKNSNLNKPTIEGQMEKITNASNRIKEIQKEQAAMYKPKVDTVTDTITYIKSLKPMDAMKEANSVIGRKGKYKNLTPEESKKILTDTEDHIFERDIPIDPEDMAKGGIAGYYTGGMVDVEPNLSDIGHGSDALMARTRLVAPDSQATTSTGLNYLLAEDNDNIRVPFSAGGGGRRAFLKLLATLGGGIAGVKSGLFEMGGKEGTKKAITETVKQSAGSTYPPPYFYKLVEKIKFMGDDTLASKDKAIAKKYKDYVLEEDFAGNIEIIKKGDDVAEDVFMSLKVDEVPIKGKKGSTKVKEYEEYTATPDSEGKMKNIEQGVPERVIDEAGDTTAMTLKKADGGRIGFAGGGGKFLLSKLGITGSSGRFLEKIFGKGSLNEISKRDPEMHRGLLEVVEMFRSRDKAGLVEYMQNFLPHMSKKEIQAFIKGDAADAAGQGKYGLGDMSGQLIRLGSGRDYKAKIEAIKKLENAQKLDTLDVTEEMIRKPNALGGIQTMLGE